MDKDLRPLTAEFVGTVLFVFLGAGSVAMLVATGPQPNPIGALGVALAQGVALAIVVSMTMSISGGHINPAVSVALWIANKIDGWQTTKYIAAQLLGAVAGAALVKALLPRLAVSLALVGPPRLANDGAFLQGGWIQAGRTFFLVSAGVWAGVAGAAPRVARPR